jgi:threonine/homoserine/homoserine lactone efflux protein
MPIGGPISLLVFHRGLLARYRDGWAIGLGGALAEGAYAALAIYGFTALREGFTFLEPLAKGMAIVLLLALGLYFVFPHKVAPQEFRGRGWPSTDLRLQDKTGKAIWSAP